MLCSSAPQLLPAPDRGDRAGKPYTHITAKLGEEVITMTDAHGSPPRNPLFNGWRPSERELTAYAAHGPVLDQATAFLTHITTTISLYTTITGGAWAAILSAALGLRSNTKLWLLGLHVIFSFFVFLSLWGVGNNFIQRLNFARWLGTVYWPRIEKFGWSKLCLEGHARGRFRRATTSREGQEIWPKVALLGEPEHHDSASTFVYVDSPIGAVGEPLPH